MTIGTIINDDVTQRNCPLCNTANPRPLPPANAVVIKGIPIRGGPTTVPKTMNKNDLGRLVAVTIVDVQLFEPGRRTTLEGVSMDANPLLLVLIANDLRIGTGNRPLSGSSLGIDVKLQEQTTAIAQTQAKLAVDRKELNEFKDEHRVAQAIRNENVQAWEQWKTARIKQVSVPSSS